MFSIFSNYALSFPEKMLMALAFLVAIMVGISFHEFAHAFAAKKCGDMTPKYNGRLSLNPINHFDPMGFILLVVAGFGWAKPVPINPNNFNKPRSGLIWVSLAGIITNLILAFICYPLFLVCLQFMPETLGLFKFFMCQLFILLFSINMTLAVFNLLPCYPLDGFNFISAVTKPYNKFVTFMRAYGHMIIFGLFILSSASSYIPGVVSPLGWLIDQISFPIMWFWGLIF